MAVTRDFKELVQRRIARDPDFRDALLRESIDTMLSGDVDTGKAILRDYIKATIGFEKLGEATGTPAKSLIRMLGPRGDPQARNLFAITRYLQKQAGVELRVAAGPAQSKTHLPGSGRPVASLSGTRDMVALPCERLGGLSGRPG